MLTKGWGVDPVSTIITAAAAVTAVLILVGAAVAATRFVRRVVHFLDDWQGEEERAGIPRRPGVIERLAIVEARTAQLTPNGGDHVADRLARIEQALQNHIDDCRHEH